MRRAAYIEDWFFSAWQFQLRTGSLEADEWVEIHAVMCV